MKRTEREAFVRAVDDDYRVHWMVDNLPVGMYHSGDKREGAFSRGFPVGFHTGYGRNAKHYLYNHIRIVIQYHDDKMDEMFGPEEKASTKIVGFRVDPMSIKHAWVSTFILFNCTFIMWLIQEGNNFIEGQTVLSTCNAMTPPTNDPANFFTLDGKVDSVVFTYDVFWEKSEVEWSQVSPLLDAIDHFSLRCFFSQVRKRFFFRVSILSNSD